MIITVKVALEVLHHEAIIREAYKDSEGNWTWSGGITSKSGHDVERYIDNKQTMTKCLEVYLWALDKYAADVRSAFKGVELNEAQFAAALSFHWNTGAIKKATWVKKFKAGDIASAEKWFMAWNKPSSIIPRRTKEADLFFRGKWSGNGMTGEYTRVRHNYTPDWSSRIDVDVSKEVAAILGGGITVDPPKVSFWEFIMRLFK